MVSGREHTQTPNLNIVDVLDPLGFGSLIVSSGSDRHGPVDRFRFLLGDDSDLTPGRLKVVQNERVHRVCITFSIFFVRWY